MRDVTMQVAEGETVGVIGRNGAGKTSLLRLMAGVTRPSEGRVSIRGRVAPLIGRRNNARFDQRSGTLVDGIGSSSRKRVRFAPKPSWTKRSSNKWYARM